MSEGLKDRFTAARWLGVSPQTLANLATRGGGPRMVKLGRRVLYDMKDLEAWVEERKRDSTSEVPREQPDAA